MGAQQRTQKPAGSLSPTSTKSWIPPLHPPPAGSPKGVGEAAGQPLCSTQGDLPPEFLAQGNPAHGDHTASCSPRLLLRGPAASDFSASEHSSLGPAEPSWDLDTVNNYAARELEAPPSAATCRPMLLLRAMVPRMSRPPGLSHGRKRGYTLPSQAHTGRSILHSPCSLTLPSSPVVLIFSDRCVPSPPPTPLVTVCSAVFLSLEFPPARGSSTHMGMATA